MSVIVAAEDEPEIINHWIPKWSLDAEHALQFQPLLRSKRGVDLRTLRRLMSNIALSEYYRLRGLEVLGTLGMGHGRPGGVPTGAGTMHLTPTAQAHATVPQTLSPNALNMLAAASAVSPLVSLPPSSVPAVGASATSALTNPVTPLQTQSSATSKQTYFTFPIRPNEFQQFFGDMVRRKYSTRRG